jgi:hypothetical protein
MEILNMGMPKQVQHDISGMLKQAGYEIIAIILFMLSSCSSADNSSDAKDHKQDSKTDAVKETLTDVQQNEFDSNITDTEKDLYSEFQQDAQEAKDQYVPKDLNIQFPVELNTKCDSAFDCMNVCAAKAECVDSKCEWIPENSLCIIPSDKDTATCVKEGMANKDYPCLFCNPAFHSVKWTPILMKNGFEGDGSGITVNDETASGIVWNITNRRAHSGNSSLYCGDPVKGTYGNGKHVKSKATTQPVKLPASVKMLMSFYLWMETEQSAGYDFLKILVLQDQNEYEVFNSDSYGGTTNGSFVTVGIDLSEYAGKEIRISFVFDTVDGGINAFEGVYIDDLIVRTDCCSDNSDCDDLNVCTEDSCKGFGFTCENAQKAGCCISDSDCSDSDPCTQDKCKGEGLTCAFVKIPECCVKQEDCNDDNDCTEDSCLNGKCKHKKLCCKINDDCVSENKCLKGKCESEKCVYEDICCKNDTDCNDMDKCTVDICMEGDCMHKPSNLPGCCYPEITSINFDDGSNGGFEFDPSVSSIGWQAVNSGKSKSAPYSLYFGNPSTKKYDAGWNIVSKGSAKLLPISIPAEMQVTLSFELYMDTEIGSYSDLLYVRLNTKDLTNTVWQKGYNVTMKTWQKISADVTAFGGEEVILEFYFDAVYGGYKNGEGLYIDDIMFETTCANKQCSGDPDCISAHYCKSGNCSTGICIYVNSCCENNEGCNDGDVCTNDSCLNKKCIFAPIAKCCETEFDCNDKNPCTMDICSGYGGQCSNEWIAGCCLKNLDCDDKDICTKDLCSNNLCEHPYICCKTDEECDDNDDKCTIDKCTGGFCKYELTGEEGCCKEMIFDADFDKGEDGKFTLSPAAANNVGWHYITNAKATSSPGSLYYGNPAAKNFDSGSQNSGSAKTGEIKLPEGLEIILSFELYQDTETGGYYDELVVSIEDVTDSKTYSKVWSNSVMSYEQYKKFTEIKLNLSAFAGKTVVITLFFDTKDSVANSTEGIYVDDFLVKTTCVPKECVTKTDCDDKISLTDESCDLGICKYAVKEVECINDLDCDDGDPNTYDYCWDGVCYHEWWIEDY